MTCPPHQVLWAEPPWAAGSVMTSGLTSHRQWGLSDSTERGFKGFAMGFGVCWGQKGGSKIFLASLQSKARLPHSVAGQAILNPFKEQFSESRASKAGDHGSGTGVRAWFWHSFRIV